MYNTNNSLGSKNVISVKRCLDCDCALSDSRRIRCKACSIKRNAERAKSRYRLAHYTYDCECDECHKFFIAEEIIPHNKQRLCGDCFRRELDNEPPVDLAYILQYMNIYGQGLADAGEDDYERRQLELRSKRNTHTNKCRVK